MQPVVFWSPSDPRAGVVAAGFRSAYESSGTSRRRRAVSDAADSWHTSAGYLARSGSLTPGACCVLAVVSAGAHGVADEVVEGLSGHGLDVGAVGYSDAIKAAGAAALARAEAMVASGANRADAVATSVREMAEATGTGVKEVALALIDATPPTQLRKVAEAFAKEAGATAREIGPTLAPAVEKLAKQPGQVTWGAAAAAGAVAIGLVAIAAMYYKP